MGGEGAMEYDEDQVSLRKFKRQQAHYQIFTHLVFYIDTPENAQENGLTISEPPEEARNR
jgi:hypothetical protein